MIISLPTRCAVRFGGTLFSWAAYWAGHAPTGLTLTLISGGVKIDWTDNSGGTAQTEIWGQSDGAAYALLYTIDAGIVTKNDDGVTPVDLRYYKIRQLKGASYSPYTAPVSIAMLGEERVLNGGFDEDLNWTKSQAQITISGGKLNFDAAGNTHYAGQSGRLTLTKTYKTVFTVSNRTAGSTYLAAGGTGAGTARTNGTWTQNLVCSGDTTIYTVATGASTTLKVDNISIKEILFP